MKTLAVSLLLLSLIAGLSNAQIIKVSTDGLSIQADRVYTAKVILK